MHSLEYRINRMQCDPTIRVYADCIQDEYSTAAYKVVELDMYLDDAAVQHRDVQGEESELFKSYFPALTYRCASLLLLIVSLHSHTRCSAHLTHTYTILRQHPSIYYPFCILHSALHELSGASLNTNRGT